MADEGIGRDEQGDRAEGAPRPPLAWPLAMVPTVALVLVVAFAAGVVGWVVGQPDDPHFDDVDVGFLADMTDHHAGALSLGFAYLDRENDPIVGHFARDIVTSQSQEMAMMTGLLQDAGDPPTIDDGTAMDWMGDPVPSEAMPGLATPADYERLRAATGLAADDEFTQLMIRHHAAGAAMAAEAARRGDNAVVRRLAATMARVQRQEILEMNRRRIALGLAAVEASASGAHQHSG